MTAKKATEKKVKFNALRTQEIRGSNPVLKDTIMALKKKAQEAQAPIWREVADRLNSTRANRASVNLWEISKNAKPGETIIVPGKVMGYGDLEPKVTIAAFQFTKQAMDKISKTGKAVTIQELADKNPKGSNVRIFA